MVNGKSKPAQHKDLNGAKISFVIEEIKVGGTLEAKID
jgi:hypothetical protein